MEYTKEEAQQALKNLYRQAEAGRKYARAHRPRHLMTDAEYEDKLDPAFALEKRKVAALEAIAKSLAQLSMEQIEASQERPAKSVAWQPPPSKPSGTVAL